MNQLSEQAEGSDRGCHNTDADTGRRAGRPGPGPALQGPQLWSPHDPEAARWSCSLPCQGTLAPQLPLPRVLRGITAVAAAGQPSGLASWELASPRGLFWGYHPIT